MYNLNPLGNKESNLANNICCICQNPGIKPVIDVASRDSYDYICSHCNSSIIISVSGSVLASDYLERLEKDKNAQNELREDISNSTFREYPLVSDNLSYFLGDDYNSEFRNFNFKDWIAGNLGAYPSRYKGLPPNEKEKIREKQIELFNESLNKRLSELKMKLNEIKDGSIDDRQLLRYELSRIESIISDNTSINELIASNPDIKYKPEELVVIRKNIKDAIYNRTDYDCILPPNQKHRIGTASSASQLLIEGLALKKYHNYLKGLNKEDNYISSSAIKERRIKLLVKIYSECQGKTINSITVKELSSSYGIEYEEVYDIAQILNDLGYIEILTKDGDLSITPQGIEFVEEYNENEKGEDRFNPVELTEISEKLDEILAEIDKLNLGHEIIYDEIESLRTNASKLSKKDFKAIALGKLVSLGLDGLISKDSVVNFLQTLIGDDINKYLK